MDWRTDDPGVQDDVSPVVVEFNDGTTARGTLLMDGVVEDGAGIEFPVFIICDHDRGDLPFAGVKRWRLIELRGRQCAT
jgi:hypothetical protein